LYRLLSKKAFSYQHNIIQEVAYYLNEDQYSEEILSNVEHKDKDDEMYQRCTILIDSSNFHHVFFNTIPTNTFLLTIKKVDKNYVEPR